MIASSSPFSFILFGASGHLATLKIYPALYVLALKKRFPKEYAIVGYARTEMDDASFRKLVEQSIRASMPEVTEKVLEEFLTHVFYQQGQYDSEADFSTLAKKLTAIEKGWKDTVRVAYLSIPPSVFPQVLHNLNAGQVRTDPVPFRCIVEKPVGNDLKSFEELREQLMTNFREGEVYLLDHYLGKEAVRNVYYLRLANPMLERLFKNTLIRHVEITASEPGGIEGRAGYFEHTGTFRDMFQSHLLMISSLLTMRLREGEGTLIESRKNALEQLYLPPAAHLNDIVLQGQYAAGTVDKKPIVGYRQEKDIAPESRTNTYIALKLQSRTSRWEGVPFYLRSGKRMHKKETRISIEFQMPFNVGEGAKPNRLDIILQGEAGMRFHLQTKLGGSEPKFRPLLLEDPLVCFGDCLPEHGLLVLEAINGKQQWFLTFEEVRTAWRLLEPLQVHLDRPETPLFLYPAGSDGPEEAKMWIQKDGLQWLE
ncbi:MAG: glucose-6-phosphate dehydrogenase [Candidatus Peregrinibacteria bacterium]|nr:glucose-6-phosphate dehydrogenase [Candidatus Peregrinibacteria bacterium]